eukprot:COSAG01_NODE_134_length_24525_cov_434.185172_16_plen_46_part_00
MLMLLLLPCLLLLSSQALASKHLGCVVVIRLRVWSLRCAKLQPYV